jgi:hypothetical protein
MVMLCGTEGVGKSALGYDLAVTIATGGIFLNRQTATSRVLIMDEENSLRDLRAYLYRAWAAHGQPDIETLIANLRIEQGTLTAAGDRWAHTLVGAIAAFKPGLVVIDTVTPACQIEDENSNGEASIAARKLRLAQESGGPDCTMLLYKHLRRDHKSGHLDIRGAKFWKGTCDGIYYHTRTRGHPRADGLYRTMLRPEKVRAFGLRHKIIIDPRFDGEGLILDSADAPLTAADEPGG